MPDSYCFLFHKPDITHPTPDLTGYITEGQIYIDRQLHNRQVMLQSSWFCIQNHWEYWRCNCEKCDLETGLRLQCYVWSNQWLYGFSRIRTSIMHILSLEILFFFLKQLSFAYIKLINYCVLRTTLVCLSWTDIPTHQRSPITVSPNEGDPLKW